MNIKLNGFYYYKLDPEKDLSVKDKKGNFKPYKRTFFEKLGELLKYGETLESFTVVFFKKSDNEYLANYENESSSFTKLEAVVKRVRHSSYVPINIISADSFEFNKFNKKYIIKILENGDKIRLTYQNGNFITLVFAQFVLE